MLREKVKLVLLLGSYLLCLGSLFTSHKSFQMGPRDLPVLKPQVKRFCNSWFKANQKCRKDPSNNMDCPKVGTQASHCQSAVEEAYRTINAGGCPYPLRDVTLCELERCGGYHGTSVFEQVQSNNRNKRSVEGCMHHCDAVRKQLDECVVKNVERQLQNYGIPLQPQRI